MIISLCTTYVLLYTIKILRGTHYDLEILQSKLRLLLLI